MAAWQFRAALFVWAGDGGWTFVRLPPEVADELRDHGGERRGFGSLRVTATVGGTTWATSVFPDAASGSFLLPVKRAVRRAEGLADGDSVSVSLCLAGP